MYLFDGIIPLLGKVLDMRSARHEVLAANIANADTPGYRAVDLAFEEELQKMTLAGQETALSKTHPKHFPQGHSSHAVPGRVKKTDDTPVGLDRNSVSIEREMVKLAENSLMYEATVQMLTKKFRGLKEAINEGR